MPLRHLLILFLIAALAWAGAPAVAQVVAPPAAPAVAPAEFNGVQAKLHVDVLAGEIGSRPAGSESQARAAQYILGQLASFGYQAELQPFPITFYEDRGSTLAVAGALGRQFSANTLQYSPPGAVEGELVDAGLGRDGDFSPAALQGKIALIERGEIRFSEKAENAARAGALGAVIYNYGPDNYNGSLGSGGQIPAVSVARSDGESLLAQTRRGSVTVRISVDASTDQRTAANVVATKAGGPQTVVIGGHFDSVPAGPGANDNGSGTAVMLELARVVASRPSPFTIKFVAFDAEEIGLLGSAHLVGQLSEDEVRSTRAMINLDMVGVGDEVRLGGSDEVVDLAFPIAAQLGEPARALGGGLSGASDHANFMRAGIPSLFVYRAEDPNYHSPNDRAEFVQPANLEFAGDLVLGVLDSLGGQR